MLGAKIYHKHSIFINKNGKIKQIEQITQHIYHPNTQDIIKRQQLLIAKAIVENW